MEPTDGAEILHFGPVKSVRNSCRNSVSTRDFPSQNPCRKKSIFSVRVDYTIGLSPQDFVEATKLYNATFDFKPSSDRHLDGRPCVDFVLKPDIKLVHVALLKDDTPRLVSPVTTIHAESRDAVFSEKFGSCVLQQGLIDTITYLRQRPTK